MPNAYDQQACEAPLKAQELIEKLSQYPGGIDVVIEVDGNAREIEAVEDDPIVGCYIATKNQFD